MSDSITRLGVDQLKRINRFAWEVASQTTMDDVRSVSTERVRDLCDGDLSTLYVVEPSGTLCYFAPSVLGPLERRLLPGEGVAGAVAASREPALQERGEDQQLNSVIAVPLVSGSEVLGVLEAVRGSHRPGFSQDDLDSLSRFAPHVAAAVQHLNAELHLRAARESLERKNDDLENRVKERTELISRGKWEWEATFDAISDPVVVLDGHVVRRANRHYKLVTGDQPWSELLGRPCHEVLAGRRTPCEGCPLLTENLSSEVKVGDAYYAATAFRIANEANSFVVYYRDITEQRALTERLRQAERLAAVGQLASGAAHEINNPLAFIISNLNMLRDVVAETLQPALEGGEVAKAAAEAVTIVDESMVGAKRIGEVVKSLRELARQEQGRPEPTDINQAVQRALKRAVGENSGVHLSLEAGQKVRVAPAQLDLAIEHVLRNAKLATKSDEEIRVTTYDDQRATVVEIADRGCGIPAEHLEHIFEPFFTTRQVGAGRGLGLTVTWGVVKRHGGEVSVHSEVGRGTTLTLTFPHDGGEGVDSEVKVGRYAGREVTSGLFDARQS